MKEFIISIINLILRTDVRICYCGKINKFDNDNKGYCCQSHKDIHLKHALKSAWGCQDYITPTLKYDLTHGTERGTPFG